MSNNIYIPYVMVVDKITVEAPGVKTLRLRFQNEEEGNKFEFKAGNFAEYSAFGEGELHFLYSFRPYPQSISSVLFVRQVV